MPTLDDIVTDSAHVTVTFPSGAELSVDYYPGRVTRKTFADLSHFTQMSEVEILETLDSFIDLLVTLVQSWNLMEKDGVTPMPLTTERLSTVPVLVLIAVAQAVMGDIRPEAIALQAK